MRLVIVSNRLPFTVAQRAGKLVFRQSPGGLASGLTTYLDWVNKQGNLDYVWIGWPGSKVPAAMKQEVRELAFSDHKAVPVFLEENVIEKYYNGFSNSTIWPLFHYFSQQARFENDDWEQYVRANEIFCNVISQVLKPDDIVWIHDYQLMLLPQMLRKRVPSATIGFYLHIPFPSSEIVRSLPNEWRREIIQGLLGADLIGFQTGDYMLHFLQSALRFLGIEHTMGEIIFDDRIVHTEIFPIGVNIQQFEKMLASEKVQRQIKRIRAPLQDQKIIFSIDRLDYTKGVDKRLTAYSTFLEKNHEWHGKVTMILTIVPSRLSAEGYVEMKNNIDRLVGEINGRFGNVGWTPVLYQYKPVSFEELVALYSVADVCFVTPLRDGMNLVAKEYVASRKNNTGVLVLSEMAGAAKELGEAIIVNPNGLTEMVNGLKNALEMPREEQEGRNRIMRSRLEKYNVVRWGEDFTSELLNVKRLQDKFDSRLLDRQARSKLIEDYNESKTRLFLLDYDGTLTPFKETPELARPDKNLIDTLRELSQDSRNTILLVSSRERRVLEDWFGPLKIGLAAEYGIWQRDKTGEWTLAHNVPNDWKPKILPLLQNYADMLPGSFVEDKEFSLTWHYRKSDPELSSIRVKELSDELSDFLRNTDLQVLQHSKVVEVRNAGITKAVTTREYVAKIQPDFILAIGDSSVDEEMFSVLPHSAYSIRVGLIDSLARYNVRNSAEVKELLSVLGKRLANLAKPTAA